MTSGWEEKLVENRRIGSPYNRRMIREEGTIRRY